MGEKFFKDHPWRTCILVMALLFTCILLTGLMSSPFDPSSSDTTALEVGVKCAQGATATTFGVLGLYHLWRKRPKAPTGGDDPDRVNIWMRHAKELNWTRWFYTIAFVIALAFSFSTMFHLP